MTLKDFLAMTTADDYYMLNVRDAKERLYYGYNNDLTDPAILGRTVVRLYADWASEGFGITVE